jgi:hypothetical protein
MDNGASILYNNYDFYPEAIADEQNLSLQTRQWLIFAEPFDNALNIALIMLSIIAIFIVYGLFTAKSWSYKPAIGISVLSTITSGGIALLYALFPTEIYLGPDYLLFIGLTIAHLILATAMIFYLRKLNVKEYFFGVSIKPYSLFPSPSLTQSTLTRPKYWGTPEGEIVKAIVSKGIPLSWNEIQQQTGFEQESLNKTLYTLFASKAITKKTIKGETRYKVEYNLFKDYDNHLRLTTLNEHKKELLEWISQWKELRKLDFSLDQGQFFLEGRHLDDFSKELISRAKTNVLVVNPFIQDCDLSNTLRDAKKRGVDVRIMTREPKDKHPEYLQKKQEYFSILKNEGISLVLNNKIHAKLIVVDNTVAIVSSMNFYPESSAGVSWEAGLISIEPKTVKNIVESVETKFV